MAEVEPSSAGKDSNFEHYYYPRAECYLRDIKVGGRSLNAVQNAIRVC
jgi:hypothetical protein